jgi:hypothetical protein
MGRSNRRHHQRIFYWAIAFGIAASATVAALLFLLNRR